MKTVWKQSKDVVFQGRVSRRKSPGSWILDFGDKDREYSNSHAAQTQTGGDWIPTTLGAVERKVSGFPA